ncbi:C1 family peptidase [Mycoplasmopsis gallopavonis]|uniref:Peptidase C1A papain C-terminal domain-containing protein n=1 Tax=Mycoplasmopsis gallopavonis TaxID=76629 RepID=A0A449AZU5_9BACT|nr:C1 family peptidase [Mycoplasmopsis gallopavonis]RIV16888.1 hypothetical protein D1113_00455 [Mycoplasmopsis gallopavonis]VEU73033.1 Uncharacterised protein [Mycoplasmopsis gallopavonis]
MKIKNNLKKVIICSVFASGFLPSLSGTSATTTYNGGFPADYLPKNKELDQKGVDELIKQDFYDSRNYNLVTPVKNQGREGLCWAYSIIATIESAILRQAPGDFNIKNLDLDENQYDFAVNTRNEEANKLNLAGSDNFEYELGVGSYVLDSALMSLQKTTLAKQGVKTSYVDPIVNVKNVITVDWTNKEEMKRAIAKYGAVAFSMSYPYQTFNANTVFYNNKWDNPPVQEGSLAHACTIVGWDDNFYASNFKPNKASQNGAWIVKNSWGTKYQAQGYFYLSYDSPLLDAVTFEIEQSKEPQNAYYYDGRRNYTGFETDQREYAAVFPVRKTNDETVEKLKSINLIIDGSNIQVKTKIFIGDNENIDFNNATPKYQWDAIIENKNGRPGGYTLELPDYVELPKDKYFAIVVKFANSNSPISMYYSFEPNSQGDLTFYKNNDGSWTNTKETLNAAFKIKAYTITENKNNSTTSSSSAREENQSIDENSNNNVPTEDSTKNTDSNLSDQNNSNPENNESSSLPTNTENNSNETTENNDNPENQPNNVEANSSDPKLSEVHDSNTSSNSNNENNNPVETPTRENETIENHDNNVVDDNSSNESNTNNNNDLNDLNNTNSNSNNTENNSTISEKENPKNNETSTNEDDSNLNNQDSSLQNEDSESNESNNSETTNTNSNNNTPENTSNEVTNKDQNSEDLTKTKEKKVSNSFNLMWLIALPIIGAMTSLAWFIFKFKDKFGNKK